MSKLFKLKKWVTVPDAATHLSTLLGEHVTDADVFRFALDGHLKLSVDFVNHAQARYGRIVAWDDTEWSMVARLEGAAKSQEQKVESEVECKPAPREMLALLKSIPKESLKSLSPLLHSLDLGDDQYLRFDDHIKSISGVWDLMMVGNEALDVEHAYQQLTDGPEVTLTCLDGVFVTDGHGTVCNVQESFEENQYEEGSLARRREIERRYSLDFDATDERRQEEIDRHLIARKEFRARIKANPKSEYYPAGGLPPDCVFVVRIDALKELVETISSEGNLQKQLHSSERKSVSQIIAVLASMAKLDISSPYAADEVLRAEAARAGIDLPSSPETVVKFLKMATQSKLDK